MLKKLIPEFTSATQIQSVILTDEPKDVPAISSMGSAGPVSFAKVAATRPSTDPNIAITDNDLAYILYTSGSTGQPKGVMISHLNSLTFVNWCFDEFQVTSNDRVSSHAPFHFDLSIFDLFCSLKAGAAIYLVPGELAAFPVRLAEWIASKKITCWYSVPLALIQLVEHGKLEQHNFDSLRLVLFAGEVFPIKYLRRLVEFLPKPAYCNLYGPTETNVCTYYTSSLRHRSGKNRAGADRQSLRQHRSLCRRYQRPGSGPGRRRRVTLSQRHGDEGILGAAGFDRSHGIPNPLNANYAEVVYRTGDIVKLMPSGDYQYIGRRDKMVKSRGYRIELGEIETALYAHPGVKEAAVVAVPDERIGARLIAYVVPAGADITSAELTRFCAERVLRYMVPERIELSSQLPKTSTGKIDKTTLENESKLYAEPTAD